MMKQTFADQLKAQSEVWKSQVKDYQERMEHMSDKAREDYKKAMEQMEAKAEEARNMAEKVRGANEAAWKDMVSARLAKPRTLSRMETSKSAEVFPSTPMGASSAKPIFTV